MSRSRPHVLIAGGGVAGLEALLALRALAADRVDVGILAPELKFVNRAMSALASINCSKLSSSSNVSRLENLSTNASKTPDSRCSASPSWWAISKSR